MRHAFSKLLLGGSNQKVLKKDRSHQNLSSLKSNPQDEQTSVSYKPCETDPSKGSNTSRMKITSRQYISQESKMCDRIILESDGAESPECFKGPFDDEDRSQTLQFCE